MVTRDTAGKGLLAGGVLLLVGMLVVSAALAPTIGTASASNDTPDVLVGSQGGGAGLHHYGSVYEVEGQNRTWREYMKDGSYFGATKLKNGSVVAGFMQDSGYQQCGQFKSPCAHTGFRIIDPNATPKPKVVYEWSYPVRTPTDTENHDVEPLGNGSFLVTDMQTERIMIVKHGKIAWQWDAKTVYTNGPADPTKHDWLHINDVDRIAPGKFLVSVRNRNQLLVVQRQQHGGKVVEVINKANTSNGIGMGNDSIIRGQHNPQWLDPGAIVVADSGNNRIVELHRNNTTNRWHVAWSIDSANGVHFRWPRDADRLPDGNTMITDSLNKRVLLVNQSGNVLWSYQTPQIPYEADYLPYAEQVGGPRYTAQNVNGPGGIPVLTFLLQVIKASYPLPYWLSETHVFLGLVSLAMVISGGGLWTSEWWRRRR